MPPFLASFVFVFFIAGLFLLNRDPQARTSKALWLPVIWLVISASRPVSVWLQIGPPRSADQLMDGSPLDRMVYTALLAAGIIVLLGRGKTVVKLLRANMPLIVFVLYCAASIGWSDYPDVAFKRWIKALGDYVMVMIVLTDANQLSAIKRVLARVGFVLLPLSVLFIKYYPNMGRMSAPHWTATMFYVGVTTDKNMLGMTCLVLGLASLWCFLQELRNQENPRRTGRLIAHGAVLAMAIWLFQIANSMTSLSCFLMASALLVCSSLRRLERRKWLIQVLVIAMLTVSISTLFFNVGSGLVEDLGRDPTLTGRTELWGEIVKFAGNPLVGTGFESFWLGHRLQEIWNAYWWHPNESHDGYLEVYLNLGWIGVGLLALILATGYRNVIRVLGSDPEVGRLRLAYFFAGVAYNFTEAGIRGTDLVWIAFLLGIVSTPLIVPALERNLAKNTGFVREAESRIAMYSRT